MRVLFLFLDGVGLGPDERHTNPLAAAQLPNLRRLLEGARVVADATPVESPRASLVALDACLGVPGAPQSATGQAALLTGLNVPALVGMHYGPWPNQAIVDLLTNGNLFRAVRNAGQRAGLLNAYPTAYFAAIASGRRLYSAIPRAVVSAGLPLRTEEDLREGRALAADFTGQGWHDRLGLTTTPLLTPDQAGARLASLAQQLDFSFFEFWLSDYAGHGRDMGNAVDLLVEFDAVLGGLLDNWDDEEGLILITSDHGNLEDLGTRGHTRNPVPAIVIGAPRLRKGFVEALGGLPDVAPAILRALAT